MAENKQGEIVYRCPLCFEAYNDVVLDKDKDGTFRCMKCSFSGKKEDVVRTYNQFRERYKLMGKRITLEEQIKM